MFGEGATGPDALLTAAAVQAQLRAGFALLLKQWM